MGHLLWRRGFWAAGLDSYGTCGKQNIPARAWPIVQTMVELGNYSAIGMRVE